MTSEEKTRKRDRDGDGDRDGKKKSTRKESRKEDRKEKRRSRSRSRERTRDRDRGGKDERRGERSSRRSRSRSADGRKERHRRQRRSRSTSRGRGSSRRQTPKDKEKSTRGKEKEVAAAPPKPALPAVEPGAALALAARISARVATTQVLGAGGVPGGATLYSISSTSALPSINTMSGFDSSQSAAKAAAGTAPSSTAAAILTTAGAAAPPLSDLDTLAEIEMKKRQERIRLFQEQRRLEEAQNAVGTSTVAQAALALKAHAKKWSLEEDGEEEEEEQTAPPPDTPSALSIGHQSSVGGEVMEEDDKDVDPLDAFMTTLGGDKGPVPQAEMYGAFGAGDQTKKGNGFDPLGSTTITAEELMGGSNKSTKAGWESDTDMEDDGRDEEEEYDEEKLEADRLAFLEALRGGGKPKEPPVAEVPIKTEIKTEPAEPPVEGADKDKGDKKKRAVLGRIFQEDGDIVEEFERKKEEKKSALEILQEQVKKKELKPVDHSQIEYLLIRKKLYIVPRALHVLPEKEVAARRDKLEIKVRGKGCPAPVENWEQTGLNDRILKVLQKYQMVEPFAIQRQALPAIMAGRDMIGVAKTGSGKTLAFLLPMLRHILDQEQQWPLVDGEGPIGLIMAPARELAVQIYNEARKFAKPLGLRVVAVYGGAGIAEQIGELKRGAHIVVCTPGRMIDILTMQAGKVVSLQRVSFVVMDEADRMFDMGFEPQIRMIIQNVRPDRQTVLFSATFPKPVENLARKVLRFPLEIIVGGRSVASEDITQYAEVHDEGEKFMRLLQLLGVWYERGNILIFVDTQQKCDNLFADLMKSGYPCLSLHGGMDQMDRDSTIHDFKSRARTLMVATSVAGRGLDVPELVCVINYHCPNHLEDYVHRVGRTGRAGRKGTAYTFITPDEDQYAPLLVKALEQSKQEVPEELRVMASAFDKKVEAGEAHKAGSGFGGKGFTFDDSEKTETQKIAAAQRKQYEIDQGLRGEDVEDIVSSDEEEEVPRKAPAAALPVVPIPPVAAASAPPPPAPAPPAEPVVPVRPEIEAAKRAIAEKLAAEGLAPIQPAEPPVDPLEKIKALAASLMGGGASAAAAAAGAAAAAPASIPPGEALARARAFADSLAAAAEAAKKGEATGEHYEDEIEINDYPQQARWRVTHRETIRELQDRTECAIINKGRYCPPGTEPPEGERKVYLLIEGSTEMAVKQAKRELQRLLDEETLRVGNRPQFGRYSVV